MIARGATTNSNTDCSAALVAEKEKGNPVYFYFYIFNCIDGMNQFQGGAQMF